MTAHRWTTLGTRDLAALRETRLQLHHASQLAAAPGLTWAEAAPDWSHVSLSWLAGPDVLAGVRLATGLRAGLRPADLALVVLDEADAVLHEQPLAGMSLEDATQWMQRGMGDGSGWPLGLPDHELPAHPVVGGAPFEVADPQAFAEYAAWFGNAAATLEALSARMPGTPPVRVWPHHFDMAFLRVIDADADPEQARSVGVGLSPGDGSHDQPYWYVTPWPPPEVSDPPSLGEAGRWHTEGWSGAVLTGTEVVAFDGADAQRARVDGFLSRAVDAALTLIGATG